MHKYVRNRTLCIKIFERVIYVSIIIKQVEFYSNKCKILACPIFDNISIEENV